MCFINREFPSSKRGALTFQASKAKFKLLFSIMSLACMRITNHFHPNHFALKQRLGAARKLPINLVHLHSELVVIKALVVIQVSV